MRIAGVTEITSSSSLGSTRVVLQFELSRNINAAAREVQAAINAARPLLPSGLPSNPVYRKVNPADAPVMLLALSSDTLTRGQMYDAASTILAQKLAQLEGVGIETIGDVARLPRKSLASRFDPQLSQQLARFVGEGRVALPKAAENDPNWQVFQHAERDARAAGLEVVLIPSPGRVLREFSRN